MAEFVVGSRLVGPGHPTYVIAELSANQPKPVATSYMGAASIGPTLATAGGLVFAAATDDRFYAYDSRRGRLLWQVKMPASSDAGPMTFMGKDGRQYVVIAAGGPGNAHRPSPRENALYHQVLIAFALPKPGDKPVDITGPYPARAQGPGPWPPN